MPVFLYEVVNNRYNNIQEQSISLVDLVIGDEDKEVEIACREQVDRINAEKLKKYGNSGEDWLEFLRVKCLYTDCAGIDPYGKYYNMTGYECVGRCFWCGEEKLKHRRYCQNRKCGAEYKRHFRWQEARDWCRKRYETKCGECGVEEDRRYDSKLRFAAHHIEPLNGSFRLWNKLNRPENLIWLCGDCHDEKRRKPESEQDNIEQLELWSDL